MYHERYLKLNHLYFYNYKKISNFKLRIRNFFIMKYLNIKKKESRQHRNNCYQKFLVHSFFDENNNKACFSNKTINIMLCKTIAWELHNINFDSFSRFSYDIVDCYFLFSNFILSQITKQKHKNLI